MMLHHLKPYSWRYGVLALILLIGCRKTAENNHNLQSKESVLAGEGLAIDKGSPLDKLDLGNIKPPPLPANYKEIVTKHRVITGSKVRKLIDAIAHKEVRMNIVKPRIDGKMALPIYFAEPISGKEAMFVPATLLDEAALLLQDYYHKRPDSKKLLLISVEKLEDWLQLYQKLGAGTGNGKNFKWSNTTRLGTYLRPSEREKKKEKEAYHLEGGINRFFDNYRNSRSRNIFSRRSLTWLRPCSRARMHEAVDKIPPQQDTAPNHDWSCGPNSAAKAINMFGEEMNEAYYRNTFLPNTPRHSPRKIAENVGIGVHIAGASAILLAPFTGGASLGVALGGLGATAAASAVIANSEAFPANSGASLKDLSTHVTRYLFGNRHARYHSYNSWRRCVNTIRDDLRHRRPVVVKWTFAPFYGHYVNVVGVSVNKNNEPQEFVIMETDNYLRVISCNDMKRLMKREYLSFALEEGGDYNDYQILRFYP